MTNIIHLHTKAEQDFNTDLLSERDRLHRKYDERVNLENALNEQWLEAAEARRIAKRKTFWRASIEIAVMCLVAAFVGALLAIGHS